MSKLRDLLNQKDLEEVLEIINHSLVYRNQIGTDISVIDIGNYYLYLWYMKTKGKIDQKHVDSFLISAKENFPELCGNFQSIEFAMNQINDSIMLLKGKQNNENGEDERCHIELSEKTPIFNLSKIVMKNIASNCNANIDVCVAFMYAYFIKAKVIDILDLLKLEEANSITSIPSLTVICIQIMRNIDKNLYLDSEKFKVPEAPEIDTKNDIIIDTYIQPEKEEVKNNTSYHQIINGKDVDVVEAYKCFVDGFSYKDIGELFDVSYSSIRRVIISYVNENNLTLPDHKNGRPVRKSGKSKNDTNEEDNKNILNKSFESETVIENNDDILFLKAQEKNVKDMIRTKSVTIVDKRNYGNYALQFYPGTDKLIKVPNSIIKRVDSIKNGNGGFYKLEDNNYYYITSKDHLVFKELPTKEMLEKARS